MIFEIPWKIFHTNDKKVMFYVKLLQNLYEYISALQTNQQSYRHIFFGILCSNTFGRHMYRKFSRQIFYLVHFSGREIMHVLLCTLKNLKILTSNCCLAHTIAVNPNKLHIIGKGNYSRIQKTQLRMFLCTSNGFIPVNVDEGRNFDILRWPYSFSSAECRIRNSCDF